jgi:hypothetical protein
MCFTVYYPEIVGVVPQCYRAYLHACGLGFDIQNCQKKKMERERARGSQENKAIKKTNHLQ